MSDYNSGKTEADVTGSVDINLPAPATGQTLITKYSSGSNDGAAIYTVTAGKTFYCLGVLLGGKSASQTATIKVDGTVVLSVWTLGSYMQLMTGGIVFTAAAGKAITLGWSGAAGEGLYDLWGYEA